MLQSANGPLKGVRIVEIASIGPGPFCGMLLSDLGASVLRIDRPGAVAGPYNVTQRGRWAVSLDLKSHDGRECCLQAIESADILIEGFRPGVMERLGLGPEPALSCNPRLVYGRITGWGQEGPYAQMAGHDINYIAISGALASIGTPEHPVPPLNLVGDYAGGSLYAVMGILAALVHARETGVGQVVDAAMSDGAASLMATFFGLAGDGKWAPERGRNVLAGGAPYYRAYCCADGKWITLAPMEPRFYRLMIEKLGLPADLFSGRDDPARWPAQEAKLTQVFASEPQSHWTALLEGTDVCFAPMLDLEDAPSHPHNRARHTFSTIDGVVQPSPAPRFSRTPGAIQGAPASPSADFAAGLQGWLACRPASEHTAG